MLRLTTAALAVCVATGFMPAPRHGSGIARRSLARVTRTEAKVEADIDDAQWEAELAKRLESKARVSSEVHPQYCESVYKTSRRPTRTVWAGSVPIGSEHPIARQTMTTTDTTDVEATVQQAIRCADAGAALVRITVQGKREAVACQKIRDRLNEVSGRESHERD